MLSALKRKLEEKKRQSKAICESRHWKEHPPLKAFLQEMRGSCTVAPMDLHEALVAVVNIALQEDNWTPAAQIPEDFLPETVYIVWNDDHLPVLKANRFLLLQNLDHATAVATEIFLISETMDRVAHFTQGKIRLYSVRPED